MSVHRLRFAWPFALAFLLASPFALAVAPAVAGCSLAQEVEDADALAELKLYEAAIARGQFGRDTAEPLDEYLEEFPRSVRARALRATLERRRGLYEEAAADLARAKEGPFPDLATKVAWGSAAFDLAFERGDWRAAREALDFATATAGGEPAEPPSRAPSLVPSALAPLHSRRIVLDCATGRRKEAADHYARTLKDAPEAARDAGFALEAARALVALRRHEAAAEKLVPLDRYLRETNDPRHADCLVLLGRTYRVGHSGGDNLPALAALRDALKLDRNSIDAQVELARARIFRFETGEADEAIRAALAVHDRHPDAWAVRAEILLFDQRAAESLAAAERALHENPVHAAARSVKVAALWILGRKAEAEALLEALAAAQSDDGEHVGRIADLLAYLYRFREAIPIYRRSLQHEPTWSYSSVGLARCLVNTGDLRGAREAMKEFRRTDRVPYALADNVSIALDRLAGFVEVRRGTFTYVMHPLDAPVLVPLLEEVYGHAWPDLCKRWDFDLRREVRIECFPHHPDFSARTVGFTGFGALGVCFGDVFTLISPRSELRGNFEFDTTAVHELAHVVTLGLSQNKVPRWLTEGISVHEEHRYAATADREMDLELFHYWKSGEIVPVRELNRIFGGPKILFGYFQGGLLCDFLVELRGESVLVAMLREFAQDKETPEVVQSVLGMSCEQLDLQFLAWLERARLGGMKVQATYTEQGRRRLLDRVRASEAPPAELLAQVAWAYHSANRPIDRDDFLNQALTRDPRLPTARFLLAERALQARRNDEALREYEAGLAAGGEEFFALLRYVQLYAEKQGLGGRAGGRRGRPAAAHGDVTEEAAGAAPAPLDDAGRALREELLGLLARAKACFPRYVAEGNPYLLRSRLLRELGRDDEAFAELEAFCQIEGSDVQARQALARRALERSDWEAARRWLNDLRMIDPFDRVVWRDLARCERQLKQPARALALLEVALQIDPSTEADYDPAVAAAGAAAGLAPGDARLRAELLLDIAELHHQAGDAALAKRAVQQARELAPELPRLLEVDRDLGD
ncbi:MAG: tetratricopeptide repeat protein [Planctomycetes bacterium]|nr:tetratricopeptide repeat protein [Planctomycetota bacterium]